MATYTKPEITILGDSKRVIQLLIKGYPVFFDSIPDDSTIDLLILAPAYDLDE